MDMQKLCNLWALPSWLFVTFVSPYLPESHDWKYYRFTLEEWEAGRTDTIMAFDLFMWMVTVAVSIGLLSRLLS